MKKELRIKSLEIRKKLKTQELSKIIIKSLFLTEEYHNSKNIICYYPLKYEINTIECLTDKEKNWYLPRVNKQNLEICKYNEKELKIGSFNIVEPSTEKINNYNNIDMIIIPAVAVDRQGYRIGYGKGFYDRFLKEIPNSTKKIILIYSKLVYNDIFHEAFDQKADIIITENEIIRI